MFPEPSERDYDDTSYTGRCRRCKELFFGPKRKQLCKVCGSVKAAKEAIDYMDPLTEKLRVLEKFTDAELMESLAKRGRLVEIGCWTATPMIVADEMPESEDVRTAFLALGEALGAQFNAGKNRPMGSGFSKVTHPQYSEYDHERRFKAIVHYIVEKKKQ